MKFIKQSFMGIELDILTGHPEHDVLFIASQAAKAAGLKNPKSGVQYQKVGPGNIQAKDLKVPDSGTLDVIKATGGRRWADLWLFPESTVYQMLLRGHAPPRSPSPSASGSPR